MPQSKGRSGNSGTWQKGQSGNPGGRPKIPEDVRKLLQAKAPEVLRDMAQRYFSDEDMKPELRQRIGEYLVDRTYGKAQEAIELSGGLEDMPALSLSERLAIIEEIRNGTDAK